MKDKLKISKRLAWIALVVYVVSLFFPFVIISYFAYGQMQYEYVKIFDVLGLSFLFSVFIIILFVFIIMRHSVILKWLSIISSIIFLAFCLGFAYLIVEITLYGSDGHGESLASGFFLCLFSSFVFIGASIIKFRIPASTKKTNNKLIDDLHRGGGRGV